MPTKLKTSDETRNSDGATLAADSALSVSLAAGTTYYVDIMALFSAGATPDIKMTLAYSGTIDMAKLKLSTKEANNTYTASGSPTTRAVWWGEGQINTPSVPARSGNNTAGTVGGYAWRGILRTDTAGTLELQWAQNTDDAADTTVLAGSYMRLVPAASMPGTWIVKSATESKATDTTPAADTELQFPTSASGKYICEMLAWHYCTSGTPQVNQAMVSPYCLNLAGNITQERACTLGSMASSALSRNYSHFAEPLVTTPTYDAPNAGTTTYPMWVDWGMEMDAVDSTFEFHWSQRVSNATPQTVQEGSYIWYEEVSN